MLKQTGFSHIPQGVKDDLRALIANDSQIEIVQILIDWGEISGCCGNVATFAQAQVRINLAIQDGDF